MLVKDIILKACDFIGNEELSQIITSDGEMTSEQTRELETLVKCFNLVYNEVICEYKPIVKIEKIKVENKKVSFDDFQNKVVNILAVKDNFGEKVAFKVFESYILVDADEVEVWFATTAKDYTINDEIDSTIPERVFAYGIAREYYFIQTLYEDAEIWEERFKNSLQVLDRKKSSTILPRRRWI